jgi:uncharacterized zinc-type alcohol dehydrogenase-like protein
MYKTKAYAAASAASSLPSTAITRRDPTEQDVQIEILYCGICHSDPHQVRNDWSGVIPTVHPCVPGHEIVGRVTKVGSAVSKFKRGDLAAVGCTVDSDRTCPECQAGFEPFCPNPPFTYNIIADVEVIPIEKLNEAYERLLDSDVKHRFSIDMVSLKSE